MRSHNLNVRIFDYRSQARIIPAKYGAPIPVWRQNDYPINPLTAETFTAKLRRFCFEYPVGISTSPTLKPYVSWFKNPSRIMVFIGIGTILGWSAPISPPYGFRLDGLGMNPSGALVIETPLNNLSSMNFLQPQGTQESTPRVAFVGLSQSKPLWIGSGGYLSPRFDLPVKGFPITSGFGNRIHPIFGDTRFHNGIDLGTPSGTPVGAAAPGYVSSADWNGGYGKTVIIQHSGGYETLYAHLDQLQVKVGDRVRNGQIIGLSGSTGYVTGPHLHFEIRRNEIAYNPLDYF
jgi:hypothetical protein